MILRALIFFILSSTLLISASGQHSSVGGRFEFDKIKGCAPLTINVNAPECGVTSCNVDFGDGSGPQAMVTTHTYTTPGTYTATIIFGASGSDVITVEVLPDIQPEFDLVRCAGPSNTVYVRITDTTYDTYTISYSDGTSLVVPAGAGANDSHAFATAGAKTVSVRGRKSGYEDNCSPMVKNITIDPALTNGSFTQLTVLDETSVQLGMTLEPFTQYRLEIATNNATAWQNFGNIYNVTTFTAGNLKTDDNYYCFRIATFDPCSNTITGYSDPICSANFDVTAGDRFNHLEWKISPTGVSSYSISKLDATTNYAPIASAPPATSLNDNDVNCTVTYQYQLTATYTNGTTSTSLAKEVTSISTTPPAAVQNITASVTDEGKVYLEWTQDPLFIPTGYEVFRTSSGITTKIAETATPAAGDDSYAAPDHTCYQIRYTDVCGNTSDVSAEACPVTLTGLLNPDNSIQLSWTPYSGWASGVNSYTIEKYDNTGQLLGTIDAGNVTSFSDTEHDPDNQVYKYVVVAVPNNAALSAAASNRITITKESNVFYPNAFTPNGDNLNETFQVKGQFIVGFDLKIYNRWGELVFTSNDPEVGWDGTFRGNTMPEGTYVFIARITDMANRTFERSGSILLLKKK